MTTLAWVVGARGLLGAAVSRAVNRSSSWGRFAAEPAPWSDDVAFAEHTRATARELIRQADAAGSTWSIIWAAGAAFTSSSQQQLDAELEQFRSFLAIVAEEDAAASAADGTAGARRGTVFLASSGGGVYAGAGVPPYTENTPVAPLAPYGAFKVEMERVLAEFSADSGISVLAGRITNLYGPGQSITKMQGLITHLALARYGTKPAFIFVPLETTRDYIFVDDCAALILDCLDRLTLETELAGTAQAVTKILGSGEAVSISTLLGYYRGITKAAPRVVHGTSAATKMQAIDLRMTSVVWPELDRRTKTPVAAGFHATMLDVLRLLQR